MAPVLELSFKDQEDSTEALIMNIWVWNYKP